MNAPCSGNSPFRRRAEPAPLWCDDLIDLLAEVDATPLDRISAVAERCVLTLTPRTLRPWLSGYPRLIHLRDTAGERFPGRGILGQKMLPTGGQESAFSYLKQAVIDNALSRVGRRHMWAWSTNEVDDLLVFIEWLQETHNTDLPPNVWLGTRVHTSSDLNRVAILLHAGTLDTKRFIILEPAVEQVDVKAYLGGIDWCIAGQSPQPAACLFDANVARQLRDDCRRARTTLFLTSIGSSLSPIRTMGGKNWHLWPEDLQIRAFPDPTCLLPGRNAKVTMRAIKAMSTNSILLAEARASSLTCAIQPATVG